MPLPTVDPSDPEEFDKHIMNPPPAYATAPPSRHPTTAGNGGAAQAQTQRPAAESGSSLFGFGKKKKQTDIEQGRHELRREEAPVQPARPNDSARLQKSTP